MKSHFIHTPSLTGTTEESFEKRARVGNLKTHLMETQNNISCLQNSGADAKIEIKSLLYIHIMIVKSTFSKDSENVSVLHRPPQ